ncbi:hypothetical protein ACP4OV_027354 [Aristida adscensionis]
MLIGKILTHFIFAMFGCMIRYVYAVMSLEWQCYLYDCLMGGFFFLALFILYYFFEEAKQHRLP